MSSTDRAVAGRARQTKALSGKIVRVEVPTHPTPMSGPRGVPTEHHRHHHHDPHAKERRRGAGHVWPGIRIHAIDIVQPPGIGSSPIADMDAHQTIVTAALASKSSAETPRNARREARSEAMTSRLRSALVVLVVAAPPDAFLVAPLGCAVEPLVHAPEAVQSARIGGIGVVDDAVLEHERADARPIARVR